MNCKNFQHWLSTRDRFSIIENPDDVDHLKGCKICRNLYNMDIQLEETIGSAFHQQDIPKGLYGQIELTIDHAKNPIRVTKPIITSLFAGLALIFSAAILIYIHQPFRYQNLQQLSKNAVDRHLLGDMTMSFSGDEIEQAQGMLNRELKFNVVIPDFEDRGYLLIGGRVCVLGKCKIAYLFYEKQNKICSLFIMDYGHLDFEMADGSRFSNIIKGYHTDIWKEKGQVYAMVY